MADLQDYFKIELFENLFIIVVVWITINTTNDVDARFGGEL